MGKGIRWIFRITVAVIVLGIPFLVFGGPSALSDTDGISGASTFEFSADDIKDSYLVFINSDRHDEENLAVWEEFFVGGNIPVILDDIHCMVAANDTPGMDYAKVCQARLPENQMTISTDVAILICSKLEHGRFDVILMSRELADNYSIPDELQNFDANIRMIEVS